MEIAHKNDTIPAKTILSKQEPKPNVSAKSESCSTLLDVKQT